MSNSDPYRDGQKLAALFGRFEHVLKRTGFLKLDTLKPIGEGLQIHLVNPFF
jgi:hypothetical protein